MIEILDKEYEATRRSGILTELIPRSPLTSFDTGPCIKFPHQAQFHPLKYLRGLSKSILTNNGEIFTETHVHEVSENCIKTSDDCQINTKNIIIATNAPIVDKVSKIYDKQIPYRTYVIGAMIKKGSVPKGIYWDTGNLNSTNTIKPYHYVRIQKLENDRNAYSSNNPSNNESNNEKKKNNTDEYKLLINGG
ncbi:FAD-dependent oxidoreductase [Candidatus Nitrosocosmicus sp. R]